MEEYNNKIYDITPHEEIRERIDQLDDMYIRSSTPFYPTVEEKEKCVHKRTFILKKIAEENLRRNEEFKKPYDPMTGEGSFSVPRKEVFIKELGKLWLPESMLEDEAIEAMCRLQSVEKYLSLGLGRKPVETEINQALEEFLRLRIKHDFEFWAITCVKIKPKQGGEYIPFRLKLTQRRLLKAMEDQRLDDEPIRVIILKSRQLGGSTLVQIYMSWIQLVIKEGWNSAIIAQVKDTAATIKGMFAKLLESYPEDLSGKLEFVPFQRMLSCYEIKGRNCKVTISSSETPDAVRGQDFALAHLSEVAFWRDTAEKKATDLIRSVTSSIPLIPLSMIVVESTANGTGDYFHTEWERAKKGENDKKPVFLPWYYDEYNVLPLKVNKIQSFLESMTEHEWYLWDRGATLEGIKWYRAKRKEYTFAEDMSAEYPTTEAEAFKSTGRRVFPQEHVQFQREKNMREPLAVGEVYSSLHENTGVKCLTDLYFLPVSNGELKVWKLPDPEEKSVQNRFVVSVDAGGRSNRSDWSVICVIDRGALCDGGMPEVVAQWRGHCDLDILAWKAAQIATFYDNALLVIESNTFEKNQTEGFHGQFILETIADSYDNLYFRTDVSKIREGLPVRYGFHTNESTKTQIIDNLIGMLRCSVLNEGTGYIEHDVDTLNEMDTYEVDDRGKMNAKAGKHDDCVMTRAIGLYVAMTSSQSVYRVSTEVHMKEIPIMGEASF